MTAKQDINIPPPDVRLGLHVRIKLIKGRYLAAAYTQDKLSRRQNVYSVGAGLTHREALADLRTGLEQNFDIIKAEMEKNG